MPAFSRISGRATAALLPALSDARGPRYLTLAGALAGLILDGRVAPATRLPSERELAASLQVSRATVTAAYDVLRERHFLTSRSGSGSVATLPPTAILRAGSARWIAPGARRDGRAPADVIDLTCATLPAPAQHLADAVAIAAAQLPEHAAGEGYEPIGLPDLRAAVADRFCRRGLPTTPDQILITNGALHGTDLVLRLLVGPGDRVLTELPTYSGLLDAVRGSGTRLVPVPMAPGGGWQVQAMTAALRQSAPQLALLIPDFQNPTGALIPESDRREVLQAARRVGTTVVVDESFVDLSMNPGIGPVPPTALLDRSVITVGSMSKPFWGGLRTGWVRASAEVISRLAGVRAGIDMGGPILDQLVATAVFPHLDEIAAQRRAELRQRRDALIAAVAKRLPGWRTRVPDGGLALWIELDAALSTPLSMTAPQFGVRIVPGSRFGVDGTLERFLRLPYTLAEPVLDEAVTRIASAWESLDARATGYTPLIVA